MKTKGKLSQNQVTSKIYYYTSLLIGIKILLKKNRVLKYLHNFFNKQSITLPFVFIFGGIV